MNYTNEQIIDSLRKCAVSDMDYCKSCAFNCSLSCASDLLNMAADIIEGNVETVDSEVRVGDNMTNEEALELLNNMEFSEQYQGVDEYTEMLIMCKESLAKQIGVQPKQDKRKGDKCYCPKCGSFVGIKIGEVTDINYYCSECGQKMKQVTE